MSNELDTRQDAGIQTTPSKYTPEQRDQLRALLDIGEASDADLNMFFEVAHRAGLDPFMREIWMIGRKTKVSASYRGGGDQWVTKWTVQTSIDGFRKSTHRYAASIGKTVSITPAKYYREDGTTTPFWMKQWGNPAAAEVTVTIGDTPTTAICSWDEYVQTTRNGEPNSQWRQFGPTMLAKCAEAAAHRRACPVSLSQLYSDEEMAQVTQIHMQAERVDEAAHNAAKTNQEIMGRVLGETREIEAQQPQEPIVEAVDVTEAPHPEPATVTTPTIEEDPLQHYANLGAEQTTTEGLVAVFTEAQGELNETQIDDLRVAFGELRKKIENKEGN